MIQTKIVNHDFLKHKIRLLKTVNKKIILAYGTFDLYHSGHVLFLERAKDTGDVLVVVVYSDDVCKKMGVQTFLNYTERATLVASHENVSFVTTNHNIKLDNIISVVGPDVITAGANTKDSIGLDLIKKHGGKFVTIPILANISTKEIVSRIIMSNNEEFFA